MTNIPCSKTAYCLVRKKANQKFLGKLNSYLSKMSLSLKNKNGRGNSTKLKEDKGMTKLNE